MVRVALHGPAAESTDIYMMDLSGGHVTPAEPRLARPPALGRGRLVVFPLTARTNADHLEIGGCVRARTRDYARYSTSSTTSTLHVRARAIDHAVHARWQPSLVLYATKATFSYLARAHQDAGWVWT